MDSLLSAACLHSWNSCPLTARPAVSFQTSTSLGAQGVHLGNPERQQAVHRADEQTEACGGEATRPPHTESSAIQVPAGPGLSPSCTAPSGHRENPPFPPTGPNDSDGAQTLTKRGMCLMSLGFLSAAHGQLHHRSTFTEEETEAYRAQQSCPN